MISILHPSRGRPIKSHKTLTNWLSKATTEVEVIVSLDEDDLTLKQYKMPDCRGAFMARKNRSAVDAINKAADAAYGDIFIVVSDDTDCPDQWDKKLLQEVEGKKDWILKTQDGIQPWMITMPVMDRAYYNRFGYIYYPEFKHMFCDTYLTVVADLVGRKIKSDLVFPHLHYSRGHSEKDAISEKADTTWKDGEKLFIELARKDWLLPKEKVVGKIEDPGMVQFINKRL